MKFTLKLNPAWRRHLPPGDRRIWLLRSIALRLDRGMKLSCTAEILWKRLLVLAVGSFVLLYLLAASALYYWWDRVPGNQVTWFDVVLAPVRSEQLRQKRGDSAIANALIRLRERDGVEAYYGLRAGLARSPANAAGRVALARLMLGGDPQGALTILENGLAYSPSDVELLRTLFAVYAAQQARAAALATTERLLASAQQPPLDAAARVWVTQTRAALLLADREAAGAEQALALLPTEMDTAPESRSRYLRFNALVQLGRYDDARRVLSDFPSASGEAARAAADLAIAAGDAAALESALTRLKAAAPAQPTPLIFAFNAWHQMKRLSLRDRTEAEFFNFFGASDAALQLFAATAVNLELPDVVRRTEQVAMANRLSPFAFRVHLTELALRRGDVDEAFRRLREWEPTIETLAPTQRFYPEFVRRLARASVPGGEAQSGGLVNHLGELRGRATVGMYELAVKVLARAGNFAGSRDVIDLGLRRYPASDPLRRLQPEIVAALEKQGAAKTVASTAAATAAPTLSVPATAAEALAKLDAALATEAFGTAGDLLRAIRASRPAWFESATSDLARRETELAVLAQDPATARVRVHTYLERPHTEADLLALVQLAERLARRDRLAEARLLRDEIMAVQPGDAVARAFEQLALPDDLAAVSATADATLAEINRALRQSRAEDALRLIEHVRQKSPPWLADARTELGVAEVRVRLALDQRPRALVALKEVVIRPGASRAAAFKLVRQLLAEGQPDTAQLLAREIARLLPDDKAAATLVREASAPLPGVE